MTNRNIIVGLPATKPVADDFTVEVWSRRATGSDPSLMYDADVVDVVIINGKAHLVVVIDD